MSTTDETILDEELQTTDAPNEWEQKYKALQAEFTRKSQENAELKKSMNTTAQYDEQDLANFRQLLDAEGLVRKSDLEQVKQKMRQEQEFESLVQSDPELKRLQPAIQALAENT